MERTDIRLPVDISDHELNRRWPIIEQLAELSWARDGRWTELVTAVRWFAEATNAASREDAFLKFAIALDLLLGREEVGYSETQTTRIGERLGFLLGENDPTRRWRIFQALKPLYNTRGGIVHGTTRAAESELFRMESIARLAILRMGWEIRHRHHRNLSAFIDWVRELKFGTPFEEIEVPPFLQLADSWFDERT
ncbi:MAG: HEPN domain-containing protein [Chloroflexota bacterium]|nr:HEPN domain-containing protein [Chloroflexota bacterium]